MVRDAGRGWWSVRRFDGHRLASLCPWRIGIERVGIVDQRVRYSLLQKSRIWKGGRGVRIGWMRWDVRCCGGRKGLYLLG